MKIREFLNLSVGEWFAQRTNCDLEKQTAESSKSNLTMEWINSDTPQIVGIGQRYNFDSGLILGGLKQSWENSVDWGKPKQQGSALIIFVADPDNSAVGKVVQILGNQNNSTKIGDYLLGNDEVLTLSITTEQMEAQERLWFASDNLRLRTAMLKDETGTIQTSFYSEIRRVVRPTQPIAQNVANQA